MKEDAYLAVDPDYFDILHHLIANTKALKVFYFEAEGEINELVGTYFCIESVSDGEFLLMEEGRRARLDRIISVNGKPGPAYDEYDNYSIYCATCLGEM